MVQHCLRSVHGLSWADTARARLHASRVVVQHALHAWLRGMCRAAVPDRRARLLAPASLLASWADDV
eukprot:4706007-Prymnesium_polylepis.1